MLRRPDMASTAETRCSALFPLGDPVIDRTSLLHRLPTLLKVTCCWLVAPLADVQAASPPSAYVFSTAVSSDTPVPDRPGTTFAISNSAPAPAIDGNFVVFFENSYTAVLWSVNTTTGQYTRLADTTTAVPGGIGTFNSFNSYEVFNGVVVFSAAGASDPRGLFSVPVTGGAMTKLIDLNTPVPGGTGTLSFDSGGGPYYRVNDGGVLFSASNGVYLVPAKGGAVTRISDGTTHTGGGAYNPSFGDESAGLAALTCYDSSVYGRSYLYTAPATGLTSDGNGNAINAPFIAGVGSPIPDQTAGDIFQLGVGGDVRVSAGTIVFHGERRRTHERDFRQQHSRHLFLGERGLDHAGGHEHTGATGRGNLHRAELRHADARRQRPGIPRRGNRFPGHGR